MSGPRLELDAESVSARLLPGRGTNGGYSLVVEGITQSHVNPADPRDLQLEYARLVAAVIDGFREAGQPIRALHLGAGALTIPRYVAATRPGSYQHVVELHRELLDFVLDALPLHDDMELTVEFDDGRAAVERAARAEGGYDLAVVDVFSGSVAPRHLSTVEFLESLRLLLAPSAVIVVNTLATPGLAMSREVAASLEAVMPEVVALASTAIVAGESLGNVVFAASESPLPTEFLVDRARAADRPIALLHDASLADFVDGASARRDDDRLA